MIVNEGEKQEEVYMVFSGGVEISRSAGSGWFRQLKAPKRRPAMWKRCDPNKEPSKAIYKNWNLAANTIAELNMSK